MKCPLILIVFLQTNVFLIFAFSGAIKISHGEAFVCSDVLEPVGETPPHILTLTP